MNREYPEISFHFEKNPYNKLRPVVCHFKHSGKTIISQSGSDRMDALLHNPFYIQPYVTNYYDNPEEYERIKNIAERII